jgi:hypothetical protein
LIFPFNQVQFNIKIIGSKAKGLQGEDIVREQLPSLDDIENFLITALVVGRKLLNSSFLTKDFNLTSSTKDYSIEEYMDQFLPDDKQIGGQTFIQGIKFYTGTTATNFFNQLVRHKEKARNRLEKSIDEEGSEFGETLADPKVSLPGEEADVKDVETEIMKVIKNKTKTDEEARKIWWAINYARQNPIEIESTGEERSIISTSYYTRDPEAWKAIGINSLAEFRSQIMQKMKSIQPAIQKVLQREFGIRVSSVLSQQLLIMAAACGKLKLASHISHIDRFARKGNVKVYEESKPQFAHEFYWEIENSNVKIAEVHDVDEDHINEAYLSALEAVQQEAFRVNQEENESDGNSRMVE